MKCTCGLAWCGVVAMMVVTSAFAHAEAAGARRPNIILIYTDDQAGGMTGFEGNTQVRTPHLDRLAREGTFFSRCYVPTPQCAPSRAVILTGQYPHTNNVTTNVTSRRDGEKVPMRLRPDAVTFSARLKKAGYRCGIVGKWHLKYEDSRDPGFGFADYVATDAQPWRWQDCDVYVQGEKTKADKFLTDWHGDRATEFVEQHKAEPFFLWLCFRAPHAPLVYPPGMEDAYPPASIKLPDTMDIDSENHFPPSVRSSPPVNAFGQADEERLRYALSQYYSMITRIDENVGRLLDCLEELELTENTLVVFCSDNGWCLGHHRLFTKGPFFYSELVRMPLVMRYPGRIEAGRTIDRVVSFVDLAPTLLEIAGQPIPEPMQGRSLVGLLADPASAQHIDECFLEYDEQQGHKYPARGIVTSRYKYIDYLHDTQDMLFDLEKDPRQLRNVFSDPGYSPVVQRLRSRLADWRWETNDPLLNQ